MRKLIIIIAMFAIASCVQTEQNSKTVGTTATKCQSEEKLNVPPEGWTTLFNGKDFTGWEVLWGWEQEGITKWQDHFPIKNGVIWTETESKATFPLKTVKKFKNFIVRLDYLLPKGERKPGNSGLYLYGIVKYQVDFGWNGNGSSGHVHHYSKYAKEKYSKELLAKWKPPKGVNKPYGEWNTLEVKLIGKQIWVTVNDIKIVEDFTMDILQLKPEGGVLAIQKHTNSHGWGGPMAFRNIFIKELD